MNDRQFLEVEFGTPLYDLTFDLRNEVLRKPLGLEFSINDISEEFRHHHLAVFSEEWNLLGCLVMVPIDEETVKMRQVAIDPRFQKLGLGTELVRFSEKWSVLNGFHTIELNARETAVSFYQKMNYDAIGDLFEEVGIPHLKMIKNVG